MRDSFHVRISSCSQFVLSHSSFYHRAFPLLFLTTVFTSRLVPVSNLESKSILARREKKTTFEYIISSNNLNFPFATMADQQLAQPSTPTQAMQATIQAGPSTGPIAKDCG